MVTIYSRFYRFICNFYAKKIELLKQFLKGKSCFYALFVFINLIPSLNVQAYVYTQTLSGEKLKWTTRTGNISLAVDFSSQSIQSSEKTTLESIFNNSLNEWNQVSHLPLVQSGVPESSDNRIYFSSDESFFGSGVLAVTSMSYSESTGNVISADIIINDTENFGRFSLDPSVSTNTSPFLGDVLTHELGHLLGLGHSEVVGSTMTYNVFKEQHTLSSDDKAGIQSLYSEDVSDFLKASIEGKIVGANSTPVFGAHVQLISVLNNSVVAGVFSEENGYFSFSNLDSNDTYYIFISPMKSKENITEYYRNVRSSYCGGESFSPSFFSRCGNSNDLSPQFLKVGSGERLSLGEITIKCNTPVSPDFYKAKLDQGSTYTAYSYSRQRKSYGSMTGHFISEQIEQGLAATPDTLELDLREVDASSGDVYLDIGVLSHALGSKSGAFIGYRFKGNQNWSYLAPSQSSLGKTNVDIKARVRLSSSSGQNIIELSVRPYNLSETDLRVVFGNPEVLTYKNEIYHLTFYLSSSAGAPIGTLDDFPYTDNSLCLEGEVGRPSSAYRPFSEISTTQKSAGFATGCASVKTELEKQSDNKNNIHFRLSLVLGMILSFFLSPLIRKISEFFV